MGRHGRLFTASVALAMACAAVWPAHSMAGPQEPAGINLGATSFFDGFGRNEEGFTYLTYGQWAMLRSIVGDDGRPLPFFNNPEIDVFVWINQLVYVLPQELFGDSAHLGIDFIVPLVGFSSNFDPPPPAPGFALTDNGVGLGDLTLGPLLQFRPIVSGGRPVFSHRVELDFVVPTGSYDPNKHLNQSSNFVSINPYWALTWLPLAQLEISVRFNYLYNFKNRKPALARLYSLEVPPQVEYAQAGQAGWINFAASFAVIRDLHVGANGYYFMQLNETLYQMRDGSSNPGRGLEDFGKTRFLGLGPGLMYDLAEHDKLFANLYFQLEVKNWPKGNVLNLRWIHGF